MTIRNIISLVESVAPSIQDIEENIVHEADEVAVSDAARVSDKMTFFDRTGNARPHYAGRDLDDMAMEGWASVTFMDDWRVAVKLDGRKVTRQALEAAIKAVSATQAGDIRIEDKSSRIPARYSGWTREGGLGALNGLLRKIKMLRAVTGDPSPEVLNRGMAMAEDMDLGEAYLLEMSEMSNVELDEALEGWQARFRQAYDRETKDQAGFERACDAARLTTAERELAREDVMTLAEEAHDVELEEARHGSVPSSMLGNMKRWDAEHVLDVKDEVEARGGDVSNAADTKAASDDLAFADKALPNVKAGKPIRGIKENARGMFVIEDEEQMVEPAAPVAVEKPVKKNVVGDLMTRVLASGMQDADILKALENAQVSRQAAKMSHVKPQKSKVPGWGDGVFYTKEEHSLVMKVFKNFKKVHANIGRKNEAVMADFDRYARRAGYHGPRPVLGPDGINAHLK